MNYKTMRIIILAVCLTCIPSLGFSRNLDINKPLERKVLANMLSQLVNRVSQFAEYGFFLPPRSQVVFETNWDVWPEHNVSFPTFDIATVKFNVTCKIRDRYRGTTQEGWGIFLATLHSCEMKDSFQRPVLEDQFKEGAEITREREFLVNYDTGEVREIMDQDKS